MEGRNAITDRLHSGQRRGPGGERPQDEKEPETLRRRADLRARVMQLARPKLHEDEADHHEDADDEQIRRGGKDGARLADTAKVAHEQQEDEADTQLDPQPSRGWSRTDDGIHAAGDRYRDGERVGGHQRATRHQARQRTQVVAGDDEPPPLG